MTRRFTVPSLSLAVAMAVLAMGPVPAARADLITQLTKFNGTITDVGVVRGPGQTGGVEYRIKGVFPFTGPRDLTGPTTFTIDQFFVEPDSAPGAGDGAGELMRQSQGLGGPETDPLLAPITLLSTRSDEDEAQYDTPGRYRPQIKIKVKKKEDSVEFQVRLDRGMMRTRPQRCQEESDGRTRTPITVSFTINDNVNLPLTVTFTRKWECPQEGRYHLRSRD